LHLLCDELLLFDLCRPPGSCSFTTSLCGVAIDAVIVPGTVVLSICSRVRSHR
jgi:hypothetical protein